MHPDDPLRRAIAELDRADLAALLDVYKRMAFAAQHGALRAVYLGLAAHLNVESTRRERVLAHLEADMDDSAGTLVDDLAAEIEQARAELREPPSDGL